MVLTAAIETDGLDTLLLWRGGDDFTELTIPDGYEYVPHNANTACLLEDDVLLFSLESDDLGRQVPVRLEDGAVTELPMPERGGGVLVACNELGHYALAHNVATIVEAVWWVGDDEQPVQIRPSLLPELLRGLGNSGAVTFADGTYWNGTEYRRDGPRSLFTRPDERGIAVGRSTTDGVMLFDVLDGTTEALPESDLDLNPSWTSHGGDRVFHVGTDLEPSFVAYRGDEYRTLRVLGAEMLLIGDINGDGQIYIESAGGGVQGFVFTPER